MLESQLAGFKINVSGGQIRYSKLLCDFFIFTQFEKTYPMSIKLTVTKKIAL